MLVPQAELFEPDALALSHVYCWCFILRSSPQMMVSWAYPNMLALWSELPLQATKVSVYVLVPCFAILVNMCSVWKTYNLFH